MFPDNLTRAEAQVRSGLLVPATYTILVDLSGAEVEDAETTFASTTTVHFTMSAAGRTHLDLIADSVRRFTLDGAELDPDDFANSRLPFQCGPGDHEVTVTAVCRFSRSGEGLHRFVDPADGHTYLYSQFEPADARRMYACFEQPDLKARFTISVIAPRDWTVVSCGPEIGVVPTGNGYARWDFAETAPISTYLTALVAGPYVREATTHQTATADLPMSLLCRRSIAGHLDAERIFATTKAGFDVFEREFGYAYPFGKYDQVFVPEYNGGAMENVGCITLRDEYLFRSRVTAAAYQRRDDTILHELSHMWFGDLVTMRWWDDLWLKESFATWASHFCSGEIQDEQTAWAGFSNGLKSWAYRQDQLPSTHPVAADMVDLEAVELNFDGITYAKGAAVLVQLVSFVGRNAFVAGLRRYFAEHAYRSTSLTDLLHALEESSGRDLSAWSAQWLETSGVNTLRARFAVDRDGRFASFRIEQVADQRSPILRNHRITLGLYADSSDGLRCTERVEVDVAGPSTEIPELVGKSRPALIMVNDDDLTYAKVRLDADSLRTVADHIHRIASPLTRAVCWGAAWDMCRDAEMRASDYVHLALRGVAVESDLTAVSSVLGSALKAATDYTAPEERTDVLLAWQHGLEELLGRAVPGSDHQLALARAYAAAAEDTVAADRLAAWLAGRRLPEGLPVDPELRWWIVCQLSRLGRLDDSAIDSERRRDQTITGTEQAAAARAAQPTARAKAEAWHAVVESDELPNATHRAICRSFWQRGQSAVLEPYVDRYLDAVAEVSEARGVWARNGAVLRTNVLRDLFPQPTDPARFVGRLDEWLARHSIADYALRVLAERRDDTLRALRCQAAAAATA